MQQRRLYAGEADLPKLWQELVEALWFCGNVTAWKAEGPRFKWREV